MADQTPDRAHIVAEAIARALFTNSLGERADRLALLLGGFPIGSGWSLNGAADEIREVLEHEVYIIERVAEAERRALARDAERQQHQQDRELVIASLRRAELVEGEVREQTAELRAERDALTQEIATLRQQIGDVAERLDGLQEGDSRTPDWYHAASIAEEWVRALLQKGQ